MVLRPGSLIFDPFLLIFVISRFSASRSVVSEFCDFGWVGWMADWSPGKLRPGQKSDTRILTGFWADPAEFDRIPVESGQIPAGKLRIKSETGRIRPDSARVQVSEF